MEKKIKTLKTLLVIQLRAAYLQLLQLEKIKVIPTERNHIHVIVLNQRNK